MLDYIPLMQKKSPIMLKPPDYLTVDDPYSVAATVAHYRSNFQHIGMEGTYQLTLMNLFYSVRNLRRRDTPSVQQKRLSYLGELRLRYNFALKNS